MAGKWYLTYSNSHKNTSVIGTDTYVIGTDGTIYLQSNGVKQYIERSDDQVKFPSSQGWFLVKNTFRAQAWEYIRLRSDGTLEIQHFCSDGCGGVINGVGKYCCVATGLKEGKFVPGKKVSL